MRTRHVLVLSSLGLAIVLVALGVRGTGRLKASGVPASGARYSERLATESSSDRVPQGPSYRSFHAPHPDDTIPVAGSSYADLHRHAVTTLLIHASRPLNGCRSQTASRWTLTDPGASQVHGDAEGCVPLDAERADPMRNAGAHERRPANAEAVEFVSQIGGDVGAVALRGDYAYVGIGSSLTILDVSNTASPTLVGRTEVLPGLVRSVAVAGGHAYVADSEMGLSIIDVSDPSAPIREGFCDVEGSAEEVVIGGDYAYVAHSKGLSIVDVSSSATPTEVGLYAAANTFAATVAGNHAYVAHDDGLRIVDITNPATPIEVGFYQNEPGWASGGVVVAGNLAYVATYVIDIFGFENFDLLHIVDVSNPATPVPVAHHYFPFPARVTTIAVADDYAYVGYGYGGGLSILNVSNPRAISEASRYAIPEPEDVAVAGAYAYLATEESLRVLDVSKPATPAEAGSYETVGCAGNVAVGEHVFVTDENSLNVVEISDPVAPTPAGICDLAWPATDLTVSDTYAYVSGGATGSRNPSGLSVVNLSNPLVPTEVGFYSPVGYGFAYEVAVMEDHAYLTGGWAGLDIVSVADPTSPSHVSLFDTPGDAMAVAVSGGYAYVADGDEGLRIVDVSDPSAPTEAGSYVTSGYARDVAVAGDYVYVAETEGLTILDISDVESPIELGFYDVPGYSAYDVTVLRDYAYVVDGEGLRVIDVSDPANPREAGSYETLGMASGVAVANGYIYVANGSQGLFVLRFVPSTLVDLSGSSKMARPQQADTGDVVTYTIALFNSGSLSATNATLLDTIPTHTTYISNSAQATSGTLTDAGGVHWMGTIGPNQEVTITFAVTLSAPVFVRNVATITDQYGKSTNLAAQVNATYIYLPEVLKASQSQRLTYHRSTDFEPALSPDGRTVVFISERAGQSDIFRVPLAGGQPTPLTETPSAQEDTPIFSPDGSAIAFASDRTGDWSIYLMDTDGTNVRPALGDNAGTDELHPAFAPDGSLAFSSDRADGNWDIYTATVGSSAWARLTYDPAADRFPNLSADGRMMVFRSERNGNSEIYLMDADGTNLRRVTNDPAFDGYPSIIGGASGLLFASTRSGRWNAYVTDLAGHGLTALEQREDWEMRTPRLSSNGELLLYAGRSTADNLEIYKREFSSPLTGSARPLRSGPRRQQPGLPDRGR